MSRIENRVGIAPIETVEKYHFTTEEVCTFLQNKLNVFTTAARKDGRDDEDVKITLSSVKFSKKFVPFLIILPDNSLKSNRRDARDGKGNKEGIFSIFRNEESESSGRLSQSVWAALMPYTYNKQERNQFRDSAQLRNVLQLSVADSRDVANLCPPKCKNLDKNNEVCIFLIDPIKVFSDMVAAKDGSDRTKDNKPKYYIEIENETTKISATSYRYTVTKSPKKMKRQGVTGTDIMKLVRGSMNRD